MNNVLKIFVLLNFVLAIVFVAVAATLLGKADNWKRKHDDVAKSLQAEITTVSDDRDKWKTSTEDTRAALRSMTAERDQSTIRAASSREQLTEVKREKERFRNTLDQLTEVNKTYGATMKQAQADRETYAKRMTIAEEGARRAMDAKETAENESRRLEQRIDTLNEDLGQLHRDLADTRTDLERNKNLVAIAIEYGFRPGALMNTPPITGVVQRVNDELDFVMLSVGRDQRVTKGMRFHISRGGSYVGDVQVDHVYPKACSANFVLQKPGASFQPGDAAHTRL